MSYPKAQHIDLPGFLHTDHMCRVDHPECTAYRQGIANELDLNEEGMTVESVWNDYDEMESTVWGRRVEYIVGLSTGNGGSRFVAKYADDGQTTEIMTMDDFETVFSQARTVLIWLNGCKQ